MKYKRILLAASAASLIGWYCAAASEDVWGQDTFVANASNSASSFDEMDKTATQEFDLLRSGDANQIDALRNALSDRRLETAARSALEAIADSGGRDVLREGLDFADPVCVAGCATSLAKIGDEASCDKIAALAKNAESDAIVRRAAYKALGAFDSKEAVDVMIAGLANDSFELKRAAADGLFAAGLRQGNPTLFQAVRMAKIDSATTAIAVQNEILLSNDAQLFMNLLKSDDPTDLRAASAVLKRASAASFFTDALGALAELPREKRETIVLTLGGTANRAAADALVAFWQKTGGKEDSLGVSPVAVVQALGRLNAQAFPIYFELLKSGDASTLPAVVDALRAKDPTTDEEATALIDLLAKSDSRDVKLAILSVVEGRGLIAAVEVVKALALDSADSELAARAFDVFSKIAEPSVETLESVVADFSGKVPTESYEAGIEAFCRRSNMKAETLASLEKNFADSPALLTRFVGAVGGKLAADKLGDLTLSYATGELTDSTIAAIDESTKALGKWATADATDALAKLSFLMPEGRLGKFKTRAIRGYLRIVRQMGATPLEKRQQLSVAERLTVDRPKERELLGELDQRFAQKFPEKSLFNGTDLSGWDVLQPGVFVVEDGALVGGNFVTGLEQHEFLTSQAVYGDFYLRLECKIIDGESNTAHDGNAGIQFRSERIADSWDMIGYQADMTSDGSYWGCLYDESRRRRMLQTPDPDLQKALWRPNDWNVYEILCQGRNIRLFLNGVKTVDYVEEDESIVQEGRIGLQIHFGGPARSYYRNIFICDSNRDDSN